MTAIRNSIIKIRVLRNSVRDTSYKEGLKDAIYILERMLQQEREQMERCFWGGVEDGESYQSDPTAQRPDFDTFFTTQFNEK